MQCKTCGGPLFLKDDILVCKYCNSTYLKEEFLPKKVVNEFIVNTQKPEFTVRGNTIISYNGNKSQVVIPNGIISVGANAFKNNLAINKVIFSSTVKSIEKNAFENCVNLLEIEGYQGVSNFDDECFKGAGLTSIEIGKNVNSLGKNCFANMPNLKVVTYVPNKNLKLNKTFANCKNLTQVNMDRFYFFPSFHGYLEVKNNPTNARYTYSDAFSGTPFFSNVKAQLLSYYEKGICPECGGTIKKGMFHAKCQNCGIDYRN